MSRTFRALPQTPKGQEDQPQATPPVWVPPRRGLLGTVAALAVTSTVASATSLSDAELLGACAEAARVAAELDRLFKVECDMEDAGDKAAQDVAFDTARALVPGYLDTLERVIALPASTVTARRARAQILLRRVQRRADGTPYDLNDRTLACLCADVLYSEGQA